jgi:REP element-mobilizing transposase RayT
MAEPPRLSEILLPDDKVIIYFVTLCVEGRRPVLANSHMLAAAGFKRLLRKNLSSQDWEWQRGCFDRLLRSDDDLESKWIYVQENPVRAGLVQRSEDWPYYLDFINDETLTASPTEP